MQLSRSNALPKTTHTGGFTLIELSIVLVIIGLIVGGVLVGRDLINAAAIRAQISQIEKYQTAARTFQGKYGYLPGDIPNPYASQFGFVARGAGIAMGNGNGILQGLANNLGACGFCGAGGEVVVFWVDLSTVGLIDGSFNTAVETANPASTVPSTGIGLYFPAAKIGSNNYVNVWSGGSAVGASASDFTGNGINYFGLSAITSLSPSGNAFAILANPGLTVAQAYNIDQKMDDGLPQSGNVTAEYLDFTHSPNHWVPTWAGNGIVGANAGSPTYGATTASTPGTTTTCYDNNNGSGAQTYSLGQNNGSGVNCGLSFAFQ